MLNRLEVYFREEESIGNQQEVDRRGSSDRRVVVQARVQHHVRCETLSGDEDG